MSSICIESLGIESLDPMACDAAPAVSAGIGRRHQAKRGLCHKRLLRRAAVGIAGTGWAFLGASDPGSAAGLRDGAKGSSSLNIAFADAALGSTGLSGISSGFAWPSLVGAVPFEQNYLLGASANDTVGEQFAADVRERLPRFQITFQQAALHNGLDWRLLAAMGYQESTWDPHAVSPTGVRGIMMLTLDTADEMDVDRDNPFESIQGGAEYFGQILEHLPPQIHEPDRTFMALAAYNQGIGHLLDARRLAAELGGSPDRWKDVSAALPLLADERWFSKTRHGFARGKEAVRFVSRVRNYYGMLTSISTDYLPPKFEVASSGM